MFKLNSLRMARLKEGKSQYEVALQTGISQSLLSLYERDLKDPKDDHIRKLALCYGTNVENLLARKPCRYR